MTRPKPEASMCGMHACVIAKEPRALIDVIRSYFLSGLSKARRKCVSSRPV